MIRVRRADERGHEDHGWLDTRHTFSFGGYLDPDHMGFRTLRVLNDDRVAPGRGFGTHPHRDMEIVTYPLEGAIEHRDSLGTGSVIRPGEVQRMSAGTGVRHSELNHSAKEPLHFLQIWIEPRERGLAPSYEQREFPDEERRGRLRPIATPDGRDGSLTIHQDAEILDALLEPGEEARHRIAPGRHAWVHVARGRVELNGRELGEGDGAAASEEGELTLRGVDRADVLVFDLA